MQTLFHLIVVNTSAGQFRIHDFGACLCRDNHAIGRTQFPQSILECIAGQDCGGLSERHVAGGFAPPKIIVIQRGQIIVDEGIGVQHFDCCAEVGDAFGKLTRACDHARGFHAKYGAEPLAACEDAVAHRTMDGVG